MVAVVVASIAYALWPVRIVQFSTGGHLVWIQEVPRGAELYLDYQHSVARAPVREVFVVNAPDGFLLVRTEHGAFGAGLPTEDFGAFRLEDGRYINSGIEYPLSHIPLRVSAGSEQRLSIQSNSEITFLDFFEANSLVLIRSRRLPRAGYIFWRKRLQDYG